MENVHRRDNNPSPPPTAEFGTPSDQTGPLLSTPGEGGFVLKDPAWTSEPPSTISRSQFADKLPPQPKSLFRRFERPSFSRIAILTVLCLITYPAFYALTLLAKDKSLFVVRLIVSAWCSGIGFALGYILLAIGAQHLEAASESIPVWYWDSLTICFKQPGPP